MTAVHVAPVADGMTHTVPGGYDIPGARAPRGWVAVESAGEAPDCCLCGPAQELVRQESGCDGWVVTHHSLDGRERDEVAS